MYTETCLKTQCDGMPRLLNLVVINCAGMEPGTVIVTQSAVDGCMNPFMELVSRLNSHVVPRAR